MPSPATPLRARRAGVIDVAVTAATAIAEGALVLASTRGAALAPLLLMHAGLVTALAAALSVAGRWGERHLALLWVSTVAFGPVGPPGILVLIALERFYERRASDPEAWHAMLFPSSLVDEHAELWRRVGQRASDRPAEQQVTPFLDVLSFGSVPQRQAVIAIIAQQFHPAFAPALRMALRDEHNVIRVQAATAIARLEHQFLERTLALEAAVRESPGDPDTLLALASHYDDQAFAGLLDPTREYDCRHKAQEGYLRYLEVRPEDHGAQFKLARLELRCGSPGAASARFRALVERGDTSAGLWLMESLYAQRQYGALRTAARELLDVAGEDAPPAVGATVDLWAGREGAA